MKQNNYLFFLFPIIFCLNFNSSGQIKNKNSYQKTQREKLVGTWKLLEFEDIDLATNKRIYQYGEKPKGYFTYTQSGVVTINISTEFPIKISEDSAKNYSVNLANWVKSQSVGYFGTYTIDFENSTVVHHVKGGSFPWYIDTDQPRQFRIKGDTLIIGDNKTWKRVLIKVN